MDFPNEYTFTITRLREALEVLEKEGHGDKIVVMSQDAEGNGFSPFYEVSIGDSYGPESTWHGEIYATDATEDDDTDRWPCPDDAIPCAVLWPVN